MINADHRHPVVVEIAIATLDLDSRQHKTQEIFHISQCKFVVVELVTAVL
jgi:hypothetical protein